MSHTRPGATLDRIGTVLSLTCALHCLLTPMLVASVSLGALGWLAGEGAELALLSLATTLGAVVLGWGWHVHRRPDALGLFAIALALIAGGRVLSPEAIETPTVVAGGLAIALAHVVNARLCRHCAGCRTAAGEDVPPGSAAGASQPGDRPAAWPAPRGHAGSENVRPP